MKKHTLNMANISLLFFMLYAMFADLFDEFWGSNRRLMLWAFTMLLLLFSKTQSNRFRIKKKTMIIVTMVLFFLLFNNEGLKNGTYMIVLKFIYFSIYAFLISRSQGIYDDGIKYVAVFGFIHVLATYLFFFVPRLYSVMFSIWGKWPSGTRRGTYGYRAALSNHYSGNGMMLALTYLTLFALIMSCDGKMNRRRKRIYIILFLMAFFAVILTTKRAHILFGLIAMVVVYFFCNPQKLHSRGGKLILIGLISIPIIYIASLRNQLISDVLSRFQDMNEDGHIINRYKLWRIALDMFWKKPILGNGWSSYRYSIYGSYLGDKYGYMNAHNVYIQLLAEVGIVGFLLYMSLLIYFIWYVFKLLRICNKYRISDVGLVFPLYFSAAFIVFYSLYSITGNCFYDKMQPFYFIVGGIIIGCKIKMRTMEHGGEYEFRIPIYRRQLKQGNS